MSFTTGDPDIKIKNVAITSEKEVGIDDIVEEAVAINKELQSRKLPPTDNDASDAFMSEMRREHKQFATSYPIVLRYMCQMRQFSKDALRQYLMHIKAHPWKNQNEYLDSQADYVVILYKKTHQRWNRTQVENLRKNVRGLLQQEHDKFVELGEKYKGEVDSEEAEYKRSREEDLAAFYRKYGKETMDIKLRVETDIDTANIVSDETLKGRVDEVIGIEDTKDIITASDLIGE